MPKVCTDPKCPLNKYTSTQKSRKDSCKIHGKPCLTFSSDHARKSHSEHKRRNYCTRLYKKKDHKPRETTKIGRCGICCKNKRCQIIKSTIERGTSTDSLQITRHGVVNGSLKKSHSSRKHGMLIHRYNDKEERSCECRRKRCYERKRNQKKGKRGQYRSRRKRKRKYSWLRNFLRKLCFCVKTPKSYEESNTYARSSGTLLQNCECCCTYRDKHKGTSKKSHHSKNRIFLADNKTLKEDSARYHQVNPLNRKCQCITTIAKNRTMPQHQSYLQGVLSKGFNVMCSGINFCI